MTRRWELFRPAVFGMLDCATAGTRDVGQRMKKHRGLSGDRPRSGVLFEAEVESESGACSWPVTFYLALERVQSQTTRAGQGHLDPVSWLLSSGWQI